jgi:hypothetical protein
MVFEKYTDGFVPHIEKDHHLWDYIYFIVHLEEKDKSTFNGVESTVYAKYTAQQLEIDWVPRLESMSLAQSQEDGEEDAAAQFVNSKLNTIIKRLSSVVGDLEEVQAKIAKRDNKAADEAKAKEIEKNKLERSQIVT